jgi:predicted anti-sigma-YlaC factor YlaD
VRRGAARPGRITGPLSPGPGGSTPQLRAAEHGDGPMQLGVGAARFAHESSAWNLALAVAFLLAATGFSRVSGLVLVVGSFVGVLAVLSVVDLLGDRSRSAGCSGTA